MYPLSFALTALLALAAVHAVPEGQPSDTPTCTYTCPPTDELGFTLGNHSDDGVTLFCSYPAVEGEDPNDFFCKYASATGVRTQDNDAGLCLHMAVSSNCGPSRRRRAIPQIPARPIAAPVARAPTPNKMTVMAQLKKRQPVQVEA